MQNATGRIVITGMGKSGHIGNKIAASLASTGTPSFFVHPAEASHGDLGMITENDVVIAISNSGESRELVDIINYCKRFDIKIISITKNAESSLGKAGDVLLLIPKNLFVNRIPTPFLLQNLCKQVGVVCIYCIWRIHL